MSPAWIAATAVISLTVFSVLTVIGGCIAAGRAERAAERAAGRDMDDTVEMLRSWQQDRIVSYLNAEQERLLADRRHADDTFCFDGLAAELHRMLEKADRDRGPSPSCGNPG